jgi:hypothetical protein
MIHTIELKPLELRGKQPSLMNDLGKVSICNADTQKKIKKSLLESKDFILMMNYNII